MTRDAIRRPEGELAGSAKIYAYRHAPHNRSHVELVVYVIRRQSKIFIQCNQLKYNYLSAHVQTCLTTVQLLDNGILGILSKL